MPLIHSSFLNRRRVLRLSMISLAAVVLSGCSGTARDFIRERDYRNVRAANEPKPAASPLPNVPDMAGWTTDLGSALEFARENGRRTVVFVQQAGHPASERAKAVLTSNAVDEALDQDMRVTMDISNSGQDATRVGVSEAPALVILDSAGNPVAQRTGSLSQKGVLAALRQ